VVVKKIFQTFFYRSLNPHCWIISSQFKMERGELVITDINTEIKNVFICMVVKLGHSP
jgi:hypothetical protein